MKAAAAGIGLLLISSLLSCNNKKKATVFTALPASRTHIDFRNDIKENEDYNVLTYEYIYNGGGVAVGDVNNDGLPDLYFTANMGPDKLYLNKGNFEFEDVTKQAGVQGRPKWKTGTVMADVNGDGLLDIYVCYSGPGTDAERANELYINNGVKGAAGGTKANKGAAGGTPTFTESAKAYGLDAPGTYTTTVSFFDMDNDGDLDMFMVNHAAMFYNPFYNTDQLRAKRNAQFGNRLYRNDNGHFTDVSEAAHIYGSGLNFGLSVAISDVNDDGWADIYTTNDYDERDFLYLNNHDGTFREVLDKAAGHISEFAMGSDIADYNNDGRADIAVLDMLPESNHRQKLLRGADAYDKYTMRVDHGLHHQQMRNTLQLNQGTDSNGVPIFSEVGQMAGMSSTDWSWAPLFADFDNDGWKDLFVSNGILRDITNLDFVKYTSGYSSAYKEISGDKKEMWKLVQKMPSTPLQNCLFHNNQQLGFTDVTTVWGITEKGIHDGAVYGDLDNDGDLDLVINNLNDGALVYQNNTIGDPHADGDPNTRGPHEHYLRLQLKGEGKNTAGIGAKLEINTDHTQQFQEQYTSRGFQSSVDPVMHIGLGEDSVVRTLKIKWPSGKSSLLKNFQADSTFVIEEAAATLNRQGGAASSNGRDAAGEPIFRDVSATSGITFIHNQSASIDFKISPLLPFQLSKTGPSIAKGDVNGDGLEDIFIGASSGYESFLFLQTKAGRFEKAKDQPWNQSKDYTNSDALFFDADGDGDLDLYLVSGGADYPLNDKRYQDRLFVNEGKGHFQLVADALPPETTSGSCVRVSDIDKDGLPDLFVGGYVQPGLFPTPPESFILRNVTTHGAIRFEKDKRQADTTLTRCGMVADALWLDLNKDGWQDLVVAGPFMPVSVFENHNGQLVNQTAAYGLGGTEGWWCRLAACDPDGDGDSDIVAGNLGLNTQFCADAATPLTITYGDFDHDGVIDPMLCYYKDGKSYPLFTRDELFDQMPALQKKFARYSDYADAQLTDLFPPETLAEGRTISIKTMKSVLLRRKDKIFGVEPLPAAAQISAVNGIMAQDFDRDGKEDLLLAGNFFPLRVQQGPLDAGIGVLLKGKGKGEFDPVPNSKTQLYMMGDIRNITSVKTATGFLIVAIKNRGPVQTYAIVTTAADTIRK